MKNGMVPLMTSCSGIREVPLTAGFKVNGREGETNFGALVVRTGDSDVAGLDTLRTENTMAAVRVRQNVLRESSVGFITTVASLGTIRSSPSVLGNWQAFISFTMAADGINFPESIVRKLALEIAQGATPSPPRVRLPPATS